RSQGGDQQRQARGLEQGRVLEQLDIPAQGEPRPGRHETGVVEGKRHQAGDRHVEECVADHQNHKTQHRIALHRRCSRSNCRAWLYWKMDSGTSNSSTMTQVTAAAMGQSALLKNSV